MCLICLSNLLPLASSAPLSGHKSDRLLNLSCLWYLSHCCVWSLPGKSVLSFCEQSPIMLRSFIASSLFQQPLKLILLFFSSLQSILHRAARGIFLKDNSYHTPLKHISNKALEGFRLNSRTKPKLFTGHLKPLDPAFSPKMLPKRDLLLSQNTELLVPRTHQWTPAFSHLLTFGQI